jgi:glycosyltransferase involved in cell wall biosynthesis
MELKSKKNSLAVIIPMFNEEKVAAACIDAVIKILKTIKIPTVLVVINDGSSDKTQEILEKKQKKYGKKLVVITHKKNKGYGAALQTGMKKALQLHYTWGLHMDSDLTNDPKYIHDFAKHVDEEYDCIKASRYIKGAATRNVPVFRRFVSIVGNFAASGLFNVGIRDCTNGFRMVRLNILKDVTFQENNFSIILEELYYLKKKHAKFKEIPYILTARTNSISHFVYKPKTFYDYFKYALKSALVI